MILAWMNEKLGKKLSSCMGFVHYPLIVIQLLSDDIKMRVQFGRYCTKTDSNPIRVMIPKVPSLLFHFSI